jgi:uncharacterized protein YeaO (DUF488 family)
MSKKPAKSERDVELPDWADDVTPADEVMKKFYAPTGTFRSGPIVAQPAVAPAPEPAVETPDEDEQRSVATSTETSEIVEAPQEKASPTPLTSTIVAEKEEEREKASLPPPEMKVQARAEETALQGVSDITAGQLGKPSTESHGRAQTSSFDEFARKWKRYLYPGQMAVMRTLFELTIAEGKTECFTRYSELAVATKMTRRNCINVMNSLVERGFVTRLEVRNDATSKGIRLRIHTDPLL